jgi:hypothetical protein
VPRVVASQAHIPDFLPELVAQLKQAIEGDVSIEIQRATSAASRSTNDSRASGPPLDGAKRTVAHSQRVKRYFAPLPLSVLLAQLVVFAFQFLSLWRGYNTQQPI